MSVPTPFSPMRFVRSFLLAIALLAAPAVSFAAVLLTVDVAPPPLPVYVQPVVPAPGFIWTPGYWAYGDGGYFWVPGTWVRAPYIGALWTPGWWGWGGNVWAWHAGYWGPRVGYYGGINYGFGYFGTGYRGGYWSNRAFTYNAAVTNVNVTTIHNVYREPWTGAASRVGYSGGAGGVVAHATAEERLAEHDRHVSATGAQLQHEHFASTNRAQFASVNHGMPGITATHRAGAFNAPNSALTQSGAPAGTALNGNAFRQNAGRGGAPGNQAAFERRTARVRDGAGTPLMHAPAGGSAPGPARTQQMEHAQALGHPQNVEHTKNLQEHRGGKEERGEEHHR
ncbi:MAG: YXWGXW repeat-containing protein [Casimicrobiaceae bacterium]